MDLCSQNEEQNEKESHELRSVKFNLPPTTIQLNAKTVPVD